MIEKTWYKGAAILPAGYDERTRIFPVAGGGIAVAHPEHPALFITAEGELSTLVCGFDPEVIASRPA